MKRYAILCLLLTTGCFTQTRTFSMAVHNDMTAPVSVCLTKTHSPPESGWESPEELIEPPHASSDQTPPGIAIPPGKTLTVAQFSGEFDPRYGRAILRVYAGTPTLTQMNAISMGSADRLDIPLHPGVNRIDIMPASNGTLSYTRVSGPWATTRPQP